MDWMDVNNDGLSPIHIAACKGQTEVATRLIAAGCSVNAQDLYVEFRINSNSNVFCVQALVPLKTMFFGALFQPSTSYKLNKKVQRIDK